MHGGRLSGRVFHCHCDGAPPPGSTTKSSRYASSRPREMGDGRCRVSPRRLSRSRDSEKPTPRSPAEKSSSGGYGRSSCERGRPGRCSHTRAAIYSSQIGWVDHVSSSRPEGTAALDGDRWRRLGRRTLLLDMAKQVAEAVGGALPTRPLGKRSALSLRASSRCMVRRRRGRRCFTSAVADLRTQTAARPSTLVVRSRLIIRAPYRSRWPPRMYGPPSF